MTYCKAWKKDKKIYMVADSAISSKTDDLKSPINSFGESQGLYGKYYVQEGQLKIFRINENIVLSFAGVVSLAYEIIEYIYAFANDMEIEKLFEKIENTFAGANIEIIIAVLQEKHENKIYYFDGNKFDDVADCEIGNGKNIPLFSQEVGKIVDHFYSTTEDKNDYLAMVIGVIQCYILKNHTFSQGVGGVCSGIIIDTKIKWFRDLEYYIYDEDIRSGLTLSVIARKNSIFSSSDIDGGKRFMINYFEDKVILDDLYLKRGIIKSLDTKNPFYYFFYNRKLNVIAFLNVNGLTQNIFFRRWIRRGQKNTFYAYAFNPEFPTYIESIDSSEERLPSVMAFKVKADKYISHDQILENCIQDDIINVEEIDKMDYDFNAFEFPNYDISKIQEIKKTIAYYHNLILIDFTFICDAIEEKIISYNSIRKFSVEQLDLSAIVNAFLKQMVSDEFVRYKIVVVKDNLDNRIITDYDMKDYFLSYSNCTVIDSDKFENDFCGTLFQLMKNYYLNDQFFHLDKFIIIADKQSVNDILLEIIPKFNFSNDNPDIILVRNINGLTNMYGGLRYIVIDYLIIYMLGMTFEEYGNIEALIDYNSNYEPE